MGRPVVHFEIGCRDLQNTGEFYTALFDWTMEPMGPASVVSTGSKEGIGGHITALGHEPHHYTIFYVEVDDIHGCLKKAEFLGGRVLVPPIPIPTGMFAWFQDPEGNTVGLTQKKT